MRRRWERQRSRPRAARRTGTRQLSPVRGRRQGRLRLARLLWTAAEVAVTFGVVVLLLVVHQLWWSNRQAGQGAARQVQALERRWEREAPDPVPVPVPVPDETGQNAGAADGAGPEPEPRSARPRRDQAYAVLRIPSLGVVAPVAEGVAKRGVLDEGYVGHYPRTAQPGRAGNFAVAGHRNTHGEPFRRIDRLRPGDTVEIETRDGVYVYAVDKVLTKTLPGDTGVIEPVPRSVVRPAAGYGAAGHYLTMTTCTPEFSSRYRLVVWGRLASMRPR